MTGAMLPGTPRAHGFLQHFDMDALEHITQNLLRFLPDALIVVDGQGRICYANDTVTELFGHPVGQLLGRPMDVLIPDRFRGRHQGHFKAYIHQPLAREMGARIADLYGKRADGSEFPAGIRLASFTLDGQVYISAAIRDMTERRSISDALIAAREEADRANRAKSRFLATASHDLRQPLQTIRLLNAAMLKLDVPELNEMLAHQQQAIDSMVRMLNALLDISRLESGAVAPQFVEVQLDEVLTELRSEFGPIAATRGLALDMRTTFHGMVRTDRTLFYQLLQNLVGNAIKYTDTGLVSVACQLQAGGLVIQVVDSGIGIPADKLERIFDEYYQIDARGAKRMGVGLGLAIVREVARLLSIRISIDSRVGEGTRAIIELPATAIIGESTAADADASRVPVNGTDSKVRILLVEDDDSVRAATELFLRLEGYETLTFATSSEALAVTPRHDDIVITDYHLDGDRTGLELLGLLRETTGRNVPGIVLTGDLPALLRREAYLTGTRYLAKPVDARVLIDAIAELSAAEPRSSETADKRASA